MCNYSELEGRSSKSTEQSSSADEIGVERRGEKRRAQDSRGRGEATSQVSSSCFRMGGPMGYRSTSGAEKRRERRRGERAQVLAFGPVGPGPDRTDVSSVERANERLRAEPIRSDPSRIRQLSAH